MYQADDAGEDRYRSLQTFKVPFIMTGQSGGENMHAKSVKVSASISRFWGLSG
jgi:hypothetical protein